MRRFAVLAGLALIATWVTVIAADAGLGGPVLTSSVVAQSEPEALDYSHVEIPFFQDWVGSGHADLTAEAFNRWLEGDPPLVPTRCGQCHSQASHLDYIGADGSEAGVVDAAAEPGVLGCTTCHNEVNLARSEVTMPSGVVLTGLGREATCMTCHQGRASGATVQSAIDEAGVGWDEVMEDQGFINIHYFAAAATLYGATAGGGYEYEGMIYEPVHDHVEDYDSCQDCHDPHTLEVKVQECSTCHWDVETTEDLRGIRMNGSRVDYDGDGDVDTGIATEIHNLQELLLGALQAYSEEVVGVGLVYDSHSYPYFFEDTDFDGVGDERYGSFTPRLLAATYNYQASKKDPGNFAHNAKYTIQLLHDSIMDLTSAMSGSMSLDRPGDAEVLAQADYDHASVAELVPAMGHLAIENLRRDDAPHFDVTDEPFRHWDEDGEISASCSRCHSAEGLPFFVEHGVTITQPVSQGMECTTCHTGVSTGDFALLEVEDVEFPSGAVLDFGDTGSNLCATCHQGRESTVSVNRRIGDVDDDVMADGLGFRNIHYYPAGATRMGSEAMGGYQYEGKEYSGFFPHVEERQQCTDCHDPHTQQVEVADRCTYCHGTVESVEDVQNFNVWEGDFDGDGNDEEGTYYEIQGMREALYAAIQAYAVETIGTPIIYDSHSYPYFFIDANGNGLVDEGEASRDNRYADWTPRLMRATYNYQYAAKDTGGFVHNSTYILQLLFDSTEDLGVDMSGMTRPATDLF